MSGASKKEGDGDPDDEDVDGDGDIWYFYGGSGGSGGSGGTGGGGGGSGPAKPLGFQGAFDDLMKENCYKMFGFSSGAAAQKAFGKLTFQIGNFGALQIQNTPSGNPPYQYVFGPGKPVVAEQVAGTNTIRINYDVDWVDFTHVWALNISTGQNQFVNLLQDSNIAWGTNMSDPQFTNLLLLHEFLHSPAGGGAPQETPANSVDFNQKIYNNCIK